jgi:hypothetical protein
MDKGKGKRVRSLFFRFVDLADPVKGFFGIIGEVVVEDTLGALQSVVEIDQFSPQSSKLLGREKGLGKKAL